MIEEKMIDVVRVIDLCEKRKEEVEEVTKKLAVEAAGYQMIKELFEKGDEGNE